MSKNIIFVIIIFLLSISVCQAKEMICLQDWIERAFQLNPQYQLNLQEHELALRGLALEEKNGVKNVNISITPPVLTEKGLQNSYSIGLQCSGELPFDAKLSGGATVSKGLQGLQFSSNLGVAVDPRNFWRTSVDTTVEIQKLTLASNFYQTKMWLISEVIKKYIEILTAESQMSIAAKKDEENMLLVEQAEYKFKAGLISEVDFYTLKEQSDQIHQDYEEKVQNLEYNKRAFAQIYGKKFDDESFLLEIDELLTQKPNLELIKIEEILAGWDDDKVEIYLSKIYSYQQCLLDLRLTEENLEKTKNEQGWKIGLAGNVQFTTGVGDNVGFLATLGVQKSLFSSTAQLNVRQMQVQLEKKQLTFTARKTQLIYELQNNVKEIKRLTTLIERNINRLKDSQAWFLRIQNQYEKGFITRLELVKAELLIMEKTLALEDLKCQRLFQILNLIEALCLEEF